MCTHAVVYWHQAEILYETDNNKFTGVVYCYNWPTKTTHTEENLLCKKKNLVSLIFVLMYTDSSFLFSQIWGREKNILWELLYLLVRILNSVFA